MTTFKRLRNGHTAEVTCIDVNGLNELASASADSTCRVWDLRTSRSVRCIGNVFQSQEVNCVKFGQGSDNYRLFAAAAASIYEFDLRNSNIILKECSRSFTCPSMDEINEISLHHKGKYLACSDDAGEVKIIDISNKEMTLSSRLKGRHQNICSSVQFRPKVQWDITSGALDSTLVSWDFSTNKPKTIHQVGLYEEISPTSIVANNCAATTSGTQALNPPLVHSVSFTPDARYIVAGFGDSTIAVYPFGAVKPAIRFPAHKAAVCQVRATTTNEKDDYMIYSAGNDCMLKLWKVSIPYEGKTGSKRKGSKSDAGKTGTTKSDIAHSTNSGRTCELKLAIKLENKPNWIVPISDGRVALADTSNDMTIYNPQV